MESYPPEQGKIIIISGPSGAGKTSICKALCKRNSHFQWSVSATTRPKREKEIEGEDYYFLSKEDFLAKITHNEFLEHAQVHGHYYGTLKEKVQECLNGNMHCLMDIDVQGARQIRLQREFENISFFIVTPDLKILQERLASRGTDAEEVIQTRMGNVEKELAEASKYNYCIVNEQLNKTIDNIQKILDQMVG